MDRWRWRDADAIGALVRRVEGEAETMSAYGIDCSHWEGDIDWLAIRQAGVVKYCILKATEGTYYMDPRFLANKAGCQMIGMPWAVYHFFRPAYDPVQQAQYFKQAVGDGCHVYFLDIEVNGDDLAQKARAFLEALDVEKKAIYTGPYFWRTNVGNDPYFAAYDLWIANYEVNQPTVPQPWTGYKIWQYSEKGNVAGINADVDENWFNGDVQAVNDYFKNGNEVPEATRVRVNVNALTIRSKPFVDASTVLGYTTLNKVWTVEGSELDEQQRKWWKVGAAAYIAAWYCVEL